MWQLFPEILSETLNINARGVFKKKSGIRGGEKSPTLSEHTYFLNGPIHPAVIYFLLRKCHFQLFLKY